MPSKQAPPASAATSRQELVERVATLMRRDLKLGSDLTINEATPFFGGEADIDSLDVLLLLTSIEREFGLKIPSEQVGRAVFQNLGTLCDYLQAQLSGPDRSVAPPASPAASDGELLARLPHQPPFRFVTRIIAVKPGESAEAAWTVTGSEDFFKGHFPGRPLVPGVLMAEALAQVSGLTRVEPAEGRLAQVDVRFEREVIPPAEILLKSRITRSMQSLVQYEVEASCRGVTVARGTVMLGWSSAP